MKAFIKTGAGVLMILSLLPLRAPAAGPDSVDAPQSAAAERPAFRTVKIFVPDREFLGRVWSAGIDFEGATGKPGGWMEFLAGSFELGELTAAGIPYEITDPDPAGTLARQLNAGALDALGFGTGSMGGYYTLAEVEAQLDSMKMLFPSIITGKQPVGYTIGGRTIWGAKISDDPDLDDVNEPEVLYTALIHAREPAGMMTVIYYMWWLLEQYGTDPRATYLVNNRQIWFIPVINADGYAYNESTNPSGGGLWRKNRRNNGDGTTGIDLNRNFGPDHMWNAPNGGSSTNTGSETYRGTTPFSEPETQTLDVFTRLREIRTCLNYHTHGRLLIYPYGYLSAESEDSLIYRELAFDLARSNRYATGTDQQTVNYSTRGNSDDFMYGDTTKFRTYAMTPEVGSSFWPASGQILALASENLGANIHASMVAGAMAVLGAGGRGDSAVVPLIPGQPFTLRLPLRNKGLVATPTLSVSFTTDSGFLDFDDPVVVCPSIPSMGDTALLVTGTVRATAPSGRAFRLAAHIASSDGYSRDDSLTLYTGEPYLLFTDDAESGTGLWTAGGTWGAVPVPHRGAASFHDSPGGKSPSGSTTSLQTAVPVNLTGMNAAALRFWTRWEIEPTFDFGSVDVSTDGGFTWQTLRAPLSNAASGYGAQTAGDFGFDGYTPGLTWVGQEIDLTPFAGGQILLRFRMATDGSDGRDGWYIDDISVRGFRARIPGGTLRVSASSSTSPHLFFGEWPGATDGIDSTLGEFGIATPPGPDTFDVRWRLPGGEETITDIRDTLGTGASPVIFRLSIRGGTAEYPLTIEWNRSLLPSGGWRIRDSATSGDLVSADMWLSGALLLSDTGVDVLEIVHTHDATTTFTVAPGWNLVSLPVDPIGRSVGNLFPGASPPAYRFDSEYLATDSLVPGEGYWIRNAQAALVTHTGSPGVSTTVDNQGTGWRLFGAVYCPVALTDLCPDCPGVPLVYGYDNGYFIPDTIRPGKAYWYHGTGKLNFGCSERSGAIPKGGAATHFGELDRILISDGTGVSSTLFMGSGDLPWEIASLDLPLPPTPPGRVFDARFDSERMVEYFTGGSDEVGKIVRINNPSGDLTILYRPGAHPGRGYSISLPGAERDGFTASLEPDVPLRFPIPGGGRMILSAANGTPAGFMLYANFPNPFNPRTVLRFDLPVTALVTLTVRNVTGQVVDVPLSERSMDAGSHSVLFDASGLASGVYFSSMTAVEAATGRMWSFSGKLLLIR